MKIWRHTPLDGFLVMLCLIQFISMYWMAMHWDATSVSVRALEVAGLFLMMTYNIIVTAHFFTHLSWFHSERLNALFSMLDTPNIGQSLKVYELKHVRNHHRYNNDMIGENGQTRDLSSTFADGEGGDHDALMHYAFMGALSSMVNFGKELLFVFRVSKIASLEKALTPFGSKSVSRQRLEARQVYLDRLSLLLNLLLLSIISWKWILFCYLPCFFFALVAVNIQNFYEHYGADPTHPFANSVSFYGRVYNFLAFNDGYHQEHHLKPSAHWRDLPKIRHIYKKELAESNYVVSNVPAVLGFLHRRRPMLHRRICHRPKESFNIDEVRYEKEYE